MRFALLVGLISLSLIAILAIDLMLLPGHNTPILFAVPVLYVGVTQSARLTVVTAVLALGFDLANLLLDPTPPITSPLTFVALSAIGYLATSLALTTDQRRRRQ